MISPERGERKTSKNNDEIPEKKKQSPAKIKFPDKIIYFFQTDLLWWD